MHTSTVLSMSEEEMDNAKLQINEQCHLTNPDFPFHYARGSVFLWEIFFGQGKFVNVLFLNISLNTYPVSIFLYEKRTKSTKISSLYPKRGNRKAKRTEKCINNNTRQDLKQIAS